MVDAAGAKELQRVVTDSLNVDNHVTEEHSMTLNYDAGDGARLLVPWFWFRNGASLDGKEHRCSGSHITQTHGSSQQFTKRLEKKMTGRATACD